MSVISKTCLDQIFFEARTHNKWQNKAVDDATLKAIYDMARWAPTSANCLPMRVVYIKSQEQKERLKPFLAPGNVDKTMTAPVTAIIAQDTEFYEKLPKTFPHADAKSWFVGNQDFINATAFRNGSLQGGYFIIAARALGVDCGPMSGYDNIALDKEFFPDGKIKSNFLCNLGYGDVTGLYPRAPRLEFDEVCKIL